MELLTLEVVGDPGTGVVRMLLSADWSGETLGRRALRKGCESNWATLKLLEAVSSATLLRDDVAWGGVSAEAARSMSSLSMNKKFGRCGRYFRDLL